MTGRSLQLQCITIGHALLGNLTTSGHRFNRSSTQTLLIGCSQKAAGDNRFAHICICTCNK